MCLTMLTRINVPIFFMISGALLLKKEENMTFVLRKRVFRIAGTLFLFDGVYIVVCKLVSIKQGWNMDISMGEYCLLVYVCIYGFSFMSSIYAEDGKKVFKR